MLDPEVLSSSESCLTPFQLSQVIPALTANGITFKCYDGEKIELYDFDTAILVLAPLYTLKTFESACSFIVRPAKCLTFTFVLERAIANDRYVLEYHNLKNFPDDTWVYYRGGLTEVEIEVELSQEQAEVQMAKFRACDRCREI